MVIKSDKTLSPFAAPSETRSSLRQALPQILAVCVKNVLLLGFGMTLGFPTILIPSLSGSNSEEPIALGQEAISWIGSLNLICVPVGCLLSGAITQPIGRKRAMQLVNIPFLTAWLLFHFSNDVWQIFLALCITGLTGGLLEAPVLTYVAEITQPHLRGMLSSTSSMAVICGISSQFLLGTFLNWRTVVLVNCVLPIISFTLLIFVPETPIWLISKNRFLDARKSIAWLRGWTSLSEIELEFQELCKQLGKASDIGIDNPAVDGNTTSKQSSRLDQLRLFTKKSFIWPYLLVSLSFFLGHFNGMTTLQTYAIKLFATLKSPIDKYYCTVILGGVELLGCVVCVILVHFTGKRIINFISLIGCGLCFLIVATYSYLIDVKYLDGFKPNNITINSTTNQSLVAYHWIPTTFLISAAFLAHAGIRILPWILTGEVFSNETRATASGLSGGIGYIFSFISNKIFISMVTTLTLPGVFWFNSAISFIGAILLYIFLPETEGKTLFDITEHFAGNSKLGNHVQRKRTKSETNGVTLTYVAEITQPSLRGILSSTSGVAVIFGILAQFLLGTFLSWRNVALVSCIIPIASFILLFFVPESPYWLIVKKRDEEARQSLAWLRGWLTPEEVEPEYDNLCKQICKTTEVGLSISDKMRLFTKKNFTWPFLLVSFAFFMSQFCGMTPLQIFAVKIFASLKAPIDEYYATVAMGVSEVLGCILSTGLVHYTGKRKMNFFSLITCGLCFIVVATYAYCNKIFYLEAFSPTSQLDEEELVSDLQHTWIPMTFLIGVAFFSHAGIKLLPWMLIGEVYANDIRATASGISGAVSYIFGFISIKIFLTLVLTITLPGVFWFYSSICIGGTVVLYFILPETEGKTLFEITEHFASNSKLTNKVTRIKDIKNEGQVNRAYVASNEDTKL